MAVAKKEETAETVAAPQEEMVRIRLMKYSENYKHDVFVSVNGKAIQIKRGVSVEIPAAYAEVLEHSMDQEGLLADIIELETASFQAKSAAAGL